MDDKLRRKPTVRDVAKQANVSASTVSRVLNGLGKYSKETEERVRKIMVEMNFEPNAVARNLSVKSSKIIGVLLPNSETGVYDDVLKGIERASRDNGYSVIICYTGDSGVSTLGYIKILLANQAAGIIYGSAELFDECYELIISTQIPCVLALTLSDKYKFPYVKVNDIIAAYDAVSYLINNGHRRIAYITGNPNDPITSKPRLDGYLNALKDNKIDINENLIIETDFNYRGGTIGMAQLLDRNEDFTAVFTECDDLAIGAMNEAHKRGIKIPDDISFMGYDNTRSSEICYPALTTLSQPLFLVGEISAEKLIDTIKTGKVSKGCFLQHEIVERESVRKIN